MQDFVLLTATTVWNNDRSTLTATNNISLPYKTTINNACKLFCSNTMNTKFSQQFCQSTTEQSLSQYLILDTEIFRVF